MTNRESRPWPAADFVKTDWGLAESCMTFETEESAVRGSLVRVDIRNDEFSRNAGAKTLTLQVRQASLNKFATN